MGIERENLQRFTDFLAEYDFIEYTSEQVMIDGEMRDLYLLDKMPVNP
ncbi:MAG: hypothetical protein ACLFVP_06120 [Candidatus Bathyarchaeia archaeon]